MTANKVDGSATAGYADYLTSCDASHRGDYYLGRDGQPSHPAGVWEGRAAAALGLHGEVARADLLTVWEGHRPADGEELVRRAVGGEHVAAVDCTFSAPKSVSTVWALASPELRSAIEAAHERAVVVALRHLEQTAPVMRRRVDGLIRHETAAGLLISRFRHHTSRLAAEQAARGLAPDPQLHDHCVVANMALRHADALGRDAHGEWGAIDSRQLFLAAAETGAVYRAELAAELIALGYQVTREGRGIEIAGVPMPVRRAFSSRHLEVERAVARFVATYGRQPSEIEKKSLVIQSRRAKAAEDGPAFAQWADRAAALGFGSREGAGLRTLPRLSVLDRGAQRVADVRLGSGGVGDGRPLGGDMPHAALDLEALSGDSHGARLDHDVRQAAREIVAELTALRGEHSLTASASTVDDRQLRIAVAEAAQGRLSGSQVPALIAAVQASPELVRVDNQHWTTRTLLGAEHRIIGRALQMGNSRGAGVSRRGVERAIDSARVPLTDEQRAAVGRLCDGRRLQLLTAPAGAGKGEVLRTVAAALRAEGRTVVALAAAGETAQRLGGEIAAEDARTIDSFAHRAETSGLRPGAETLLIVDEAALLETWRWDALLAAAGEATVIAAGDAAQLSPIEAGGMWPVLDARVGSVTLTENHRARADWARDAWSALRDGASAAALASYEQRGLLSLRETRLEARAAAVAAWDADRRAGAAAGVGIDQFLLLCDSSNLDVDSLNLLAQERRMAAGELGVDSVEISSVDSSGRLREEALHVGDRVTFERQVYPREGAVVVGGPVLDVGVGGPRRDVDRSGGVGTVPGGDPVGVGGGWDTSGQSPQSRVGHLTYTDSDRSDAAPVLDVAVSDPADVGENSGRGSEVPPRPGRDASGGWDVPDEMNSARRDTGEIGPRTADEDIHRTHRERSDPADRLHGTQPPHSRVGHLTYTDPDRSPARLPHRIENGEAGTVIAVEPATGRALVQLRDRTVRLDADQVSALRLGYAQHVYSAQGRTVERAYVVTGGWQTDRERSYVAVSRARDVTRVFVDSSSLDVAPGDRAAALSELARRVGQSRPAVAAVTLLERAGQDVPVISTLSAGERSKCGVAAVITVDPRQREALTAAPVAHGR